MDELIVLVHSPLVGPLTWSLVAQHLQALGFDVLVPTLVDSGETPPPYWQQHAASFQQALASIPQERPLILVGHSGAGPLLPALARSAHHPVSGYVFVDAGLPHPGQSHLNEMETSVPEFAQELHQHLASGGSFPNWSDEDLRDELPDEHVRRKMLAEMQPRSFDYFEENMPDVAGWPEASCAYLLFTQGYRHSLEQAQGAGWPNRTLAAGHFHMLVDPVAVATELVELMQRMKEMSSR
jgi:pimeloyl-ACP methyl ester carboxylesterase